MFTLTFFTIEKNGRRKGGDLELIRWQWLKQVENVKFWRYDLLKEQEFLCEGMELRGC